MMYSFDEENVTLHVAEEKSVVKWDVTARAMELSTLLMHFLGVGWEWHMLLNGSLLITYP